MRAARVIKPKESLEIKDVELPAPVSNQVIVKVESSGVCHSDIHVWQGGYEGTRGQMMKVEDRGVKFPLTLGHEIAGTVEAVGPKVNNTKAGDKVLVYPWIGDGTCPACQVGDEHICDNPRSLGIFQDGGYAERVLVPDEKYLVKVGNALGFEEICSLACSGLTAYTAIKNASVSPKQSIVIVGAGGLGLMGVQIARALLNPSITVVDINEKALEQAKKLGADGVVDAKSDDAIKQVKDLTSGGLGADSVVDFVNSPKTVEPAINMLQKRGKLVLVGLFGGSIELNLPMVPLRAYNIVGSYTGRLADLPDLVKLVERKSVTPVVSKTYSLDEANTALEQLKSGNIVGRAVLKP